MADQIAPQMKELEAAMQRANELIQKGSTKRDVSAADGSCSSSCLTGKAGAIVAEVTYTIKGVVKSLGLGK